MASVVAGIPGVAVYINDIVVHGPDQKTHDEHLDQVFQRLASHHLTVNAEKCLFGVEEILFVGHRISSEETAPLLSNVEAILLNNTNISLRTKYVSGHKRILSALLGRSRKDR